MAGRKSKLTPEAQERIVQAIRVGATYELAAQFGGIAYNTFNEWMKAGAAAETGVKREFYEAIKAAEGEAAIKWLALIDKAAVDTWQAAAWKLERRYPENYGRQVQDMRHSGTGKDGEIEISVNDSRDEIQRKLAGIATAIGSGAISGQSNAE